ncbi:MAG: hypothetical protein QXO40_00370 [Candidatus Aenigmatarchaeota archaeon]
MVSKFLIFLLIIFIVLSVIIYFIISILTKVEIREYVPKIIFSRDAFLDVNFLFSDFDETSSEYNYAFYIQNNFLEILNLNIFSEFLILDEDVKITLYKEEFSDLLAPNVKKRYDISVKNIFDNSKISGLNFCEEERNLVLGCEYGCCKGDNVNDGICWKDCKIYKLDPFEKNKNLYCQAFPIIYTSISYSATINGTVEISKNTYDDRIKWNVGKSPINIFIRPSPLPYNNLLPLILTFEIEGENVFLRKIKLEIIDYSIEVETFFEKKIESLESSQICEIEVNRFINGKVYLGKERSCTFEPLNITVKRILKDRVEEETKTKTEYINKLINYVCKEYISDGKIDYENCAKELNKREYNICSLYSDLEICKIGEEKLNKIIILISAEIEKREEYRKKLIPTFC